MSSNFFITAIFIVLLSALLAINNTLIFSSWLEKLSGRHDDKNFPVHEAVPIEGAVGPESFAFDPEGGGPYTGISDGRIVKWQQDENQWVNFAITSSDRGGCEGLHDHHQTEHICGRPLGLRFNESNGDLYIADAYMGLLKVGPQGGLATKVATQAQGIPFSFTNSLDIDPSSQAVLYFTDSTSNYRRRNYVSAILSGDRSGRLMSYDPESRQVQVIIQDLSFPNGVAMSKDGNFILVAETSKCRILRYWLRTRRAGDVDVFLSELIGFPDNIKRSPRGGFWVGINSRREGIVKLILSYPWIGKGLVKVVSLDVIMKVYTSLVKWRGASGLGIRVSEKGKVLEVVEGNGSVAEVEERDNGILWIGSINTPFAAKLHV